MKKSLYIFIAITIIFPGIISAQKIDNKGAETKETFSLTSENIDLREKSLDEQILSLNQKIAAVIKKYDLLKTKDIRILPYQTTYNIGDNFIEIEKHMFIKNDIYKNEIVGIRKKSIKIYTNGESINKVETEIYETHYTNGDKNIVTITDPSPTAGGTEDMIFNHSWRGKTIVNNKTMSKIKNTTAYPLRNQIKRDFIVPHLTEFYRSLLFIAEAYYKSMKDSDSAMRNFLEKSMKY